MTIPTPEDVTAYLGDQSTSSEEEVTAALAAELAAAATRLNLPADGEEWPADLVEAMCRRTARNLAIRSLPLGVQPGIDGGVVRVGGFDPEAARLEAPYRKIVVG